MSREFVSSLVPPHGGVLVDRILHGPAAESLRREAASAPRITLDAREQADLELIATGAASPLEGFLGPADYASVVDTLRLANGTVWPLPFTLATDDKGLAPGTAAALYDASGRLWGVIEVEHV